MKAGRITIQREQSPKKGALAPIEIELVDRETNRRVALALVDPATFLRALMGGSSVQCSFTTSYTEDE